MTRRDGTAVGDGPNVLLVVMDTARADCFEPYGAPADSTPAVAQLASAGRARESVFATANWTVPSHASMLTGLMPGALGLGQAPEGSPVGCRQVLEALDPVLLPAVLSREGYSTAGISTNLWITQHSGFHTGFENFEVVQTVRNDQMNDPKLRHRIAWDLEGLRARGDDGAHVARDLLAQWAKDKESDKRPFFWFVNLTECHSPYLPPKPYNDMGPIGRLRAAEEARRHLNLGAIWRTCLGNHRIPPKAVERMRHLYKRSIRYMDDWFAEVLEILDARRMLDETVVIVTSDHGENLGEGELIGHAFSLDDRLVRVPLVSSSRDLLPGDSPASLRDLPRAIAELVGITEHPWEERPSAGEAAVAQIEGLAGPDDPRAQLVVDLWKLDEAAFRRMTSSGWCATDGRHKLLCLEDEEFLFDLDKDPLELEPLVVKTTDDPHVKEVSEKLRAAGRAESSEAWDTQPAGERGAPMVSAPPQPSAEEVDAIAQRMRRLGYL